jgi:hypothetical protein
MLLILSELLETGVPKSGEMQGTDEFSVKPSEKYSWSGSLDKLSSREELRSALWQEDTFVDFQKGLHTAIKRLREAWGPSSRVRRTGRANSCDV